MDGDLGKRKRAKVSHRVGGGVRSASNEKPGCIQTRPIMGVLEEIVARSWVFRGKGRKLKRA